MHMHKSAGACIGYLDKAALIREWFLVSLLYTVRLSGGQPGAGRSSQEQPGAAKSRQEPPGAAWSHQEPPGAARSSQGQPGAARSSQEQPGAALRGGRALQVM
jgi:hypothetical protein